MEKKNESNGDEDQLWVLNTVGELEKKVFNTIFESFWLGIVDPIL